MSYGQKRLLREITPTELLRTLNKLKDVVFKDDYQNVFLLDDDGILECGSVHNTHIKVKNANAVALYSDGSFVLTDEYDDQYSFTIQKMIQHCEW